MDNVTTNKKPENPRKRANWLSIITLWYAVPIFLLGCRGKINVDTLYETLPEHKSSYLGEIIEAKWRSELKRASIANRKPSLTRVLWQMFGLRYIGHGLITAIFELCVKIIQPLALGQFIAFYDPNQTSISLTDAYLYGGVIIVSSFIGAILKNPNSMGSAVLGMKAKTACSSLIYRKSLKLNKATIETAGSGKILNLLSNDISKFDNFVQFANYIWICPIQAIIITYFMYQEVGFSSVIGVATLVCFIPIILFLGKQLSVHRLNTAKKTDERINLMSEIIIGIQAIKMYTWEKLFINLVNKTRRNEIKFIAKASYCKGIIAALNLCLNHVALYVTILVYGLLYHDFNAQQVFVLASYYTVLKTTLTWSFGYGISSIAVLKISIKRLNEFLVIEENAGHTPIDPNDLYTITSSFMSNDCHSITLINGTANWLKTCTENTLTDINLEIKHGALVAIVGSVGSGKSSLLYTILKELPLISGMLTVNGTISYASQGSWIFPTSIRQNILFGLPMNKTRYKKVVKYCALKRDISLFPYGDKTLIGERGITLSGGQKSRINLARAVYKDADIYLLDDPLSAVDTLVGNQLFEECISTFLKNKTVILVTHQLQYLKDVDNIILLEKGRIKCQGNYLTLNVHSTEFTNLLKEIGEQKSNTENENVFFRRRNYSRQRTTSISSIEGDSIEAPEEIAEQSGSGSISGYLYRVYFTTGSNYFLIGYNIILFVSSAFAPNLCTYFLTLWVNSVQKVSVYVQLNNKTGDILSLEKTKYDFVTNIYIYSGIVAVTIIISGLRSWSFYNMCTRSSVKLHDNLFRGVIRATMRFFHVNTSGRILNRFSKDVGTIDELLPDNILFSLDFGLVVIAAVVFIIIVNPWLTIPSVIFWIIFYFAGKIYLVTSTSIKRLEGVTKSPVFTYLNVSIQGLSTIRAFNVQPILEREFDNHQDLHSSTLYLFIVTERALGIFIDMLCVIYIAIVTMSFPVLKNERFGGNVGLAVSLVIGLTNSLQFFVRQSTQMENNMTAVERVLEYTNVETEANLESEPGRKPLQLWPEKGKIKFINLYLRYSPSEPSVLKNLNLVIKPREKIGIVGRTGAGKSSIIYALFRMAQTSGEIIIDNVDIHSIGLHDLRSKISIIPQQPVFLTGTLRRNLDPLDDYHDREIWKALEEVEIKDIIMGFPLGLYTAVVDGGLNFSVGQRQLICLARVILRNNKILVLDEATANIDVHTDSLIQKTIKNKFSHCTVLTIAHRLNTIMDSDKIMVLDAGRLVEFDHPHLLLQKPESLFYNLVQQTGEDTQKTLTSIAEKKHMELDPNEDLIAL